jgi:TRAP-type C4-dicarboxylate transport system permease small subunit
MEPHRFPDDSSVSSTLRTIDNYVGLIEQGLLFAIFAAVVLVASLSALSGHIAHHQIGQWWHFVVRKGTFAIAMLGAAFATHQQRLLAMDLVSRRLPPKGRLILGIVIKLFTIAICVVLYHIGWVLRDQGMGTAGPTLSLGFTLTERDVVAVIPIGAALIIFHCLVHAAIEIDYLVRGKLLPERARSGH